MKISGMFAAGLFALVLAAGCATQPEADAAATTGGSAESSTSGAAKTDEKPATETGGASTEKPVNPEDVAKEATQPVGAAADAGKPKAGEDVAVIETAMGRIVFKFRPDKAPKHVENFKELAKRKFYDGTRFHRCIEGFMIQGGDPNSKDLAKASTWGMGGNVVNGEEKMIPLETSDMLHKRGVVSMARSSDPNSASSQFFIMHQDSPSLDGQYSAFGEVLSGQEVVDKIVVTGDPANNGSVEPDKAVVVKSIRIEKWPVKK